MDERTNYFYIAKKERLNGRKSMKVKVRDKIYPKGKGSKRLRIGNLNGFPGCSSELYGIAIGSANEYLKYDTINELRIVTHQLKGILEQNCLPCIAS